MKKKFKKVIIFSQNMLKIFQVINKSYFNIKFIQINHTFFCNFFFSIYNVK